MTDLEDYINPNTGRVNRGFVSNEERETPSNLPRDKKDRITENKVIQEPQLFDAIVQHVYDRKDSYAYKWLMRYLSKIINAIYKLSAVLAKSNKKKINSIQIPAFSGGKSETISSGTLDFYMDQVKAIMANLVSGYVTATKRTKYLPNQAKGADFTVYRVGPAFKTFVRNAFPSNVAGSPPSLVGNEDLAFRGTVRDILYNYFTQHRLSPERARTVGIDGPDVSGYDRNVEADRKKIKQLEDLYYSGVVLVDGALATLLRETIPTYTTGDNGTKCPNDNNVPLSENLGDNLVANDSGTQYLLYNRAANTIVAGSVTKVITPEVLNSIRGGRNPYPEQDYTTVHAERLIQRERNQEASKARKKGKSRRTKGS